MEQFQEWLVANGRGIFARLSGGSPRKAMRIYATAIFLAGVVTGLLLMVLATLPGVVILLGLSGAAGYAVRSFVSYRRRQAARRNRF